MRQPKVVVGFLGWAEEVNLKSIADFAVGNKVSTRKERRGRAWTVVWSEVWLYNPYANPRSSWAVGKWGPLPLDAMETKACKW